MSEEEFLEEYRVDRPDTANLIIIPFSRYRSDLYCYVKNKKFYIPKDEIGYFRLPHSTVLCVAVGSRARMARSARKAIRIGKLRLVVVLDGFNARSAAYVKVLNNVEEIWSYADGHGMTFGFLGIIQAFPAQADYWLPGHHDHGPGRVRRVIITAKDIYYTSIDADVYELLTEETEEDG